MIRILIVIAFVCAVIALVVALIPSTFLSLGPTGWIAASLVAFYFDMLVGGWAVNVGPRPSA